MKTENGRRSSKKENMENYKTTLDDENGRMAAPVQAQNGKKKSIKNCYKTAQFCRIPHIVLEVTQ